MDKKKLEEIKTAKKKVVDGSLTLWNARLDELVEGDYNRDFINFIGGSVDNVALTNICGCPEPGSPVCQCKCPPSSLIDYDSRINVMGQMINEIGEEIKAIKKKLK
jgi:hypothetical protein